ncbi:MAG: Fe-S cluster assembly protein SufD [Propioniciclava sp.]|uniref:Fe-S cluster assembly protein SufD n=1 Tax=Propioniciclava sp. TaxID=2038686 RepID=UPI0039E4E092
MTVTEVPNVAGAIETIESHLHPKPSFDLADHPVPTGREEVWRFTPLHRIKPLLAEAPDADGVRVGVEAPEGVVVTSAVRGASPRGDVLVPGDRTAALADAGAAEATVVRIPANAELTEPVRLDLVGTDASARSARVYVIVAEPNSKATVVLRHTGSAQVLENVEIDVQPGANLTVVSLQNWDDDALHAGEQTARVGRDATYRHVNVTFGGSVVRLHTNMYYEGTGGEAELFGLYFADAGQHLEHRLFVDHNAPQTRSNVDYRGALQGKDAHSVWVGDVLIRKVAEGIETYESNKNLVLTEGARADSVPNLEIETGEIAGAGHSSTTGRFDDEHLFYLTSRGIDPVEAKRLVVMGFFVDIIRRIGVDDVEARLIAEVERELASTVGAAPAASLEG